MYPLQPEVSKLDLPPIVWGRGGRSALQSYGAGTAWEFHIRLTVSSSCTVYSQITCSLWWKQFPTAQIVPGVDESRMHPKKIRSHKQVMGGHWWPLVNSFNLREAPADLVLRGGSCSSCDLSMHVPRSHPSFHRSFHPEPVLASRFRDHDP